MASQNQKPSFVFFGTPDLAVSALEGLSKHGYLPTAIVTSPDKPVGRHQVLSPSPTKVWGLAHHIPVLEPAKIDDAFFAELSTLNFELGIVAAYGKILPEKLLTMPTFGTLNIHPSLLPLYRGTAPVVGPILAGDIKTGVSIIKLDAKVDHGPIMFQDERILTGNERANDLGNELFCHGGEMLSKIIPEYILGKIILTEQDHTKATFTKKIKKEDGLVDLGVELPSVLWRKYRAYYGWPGIYFMDKNNKRVKITDAMYEDGMFKIQKVIPEGKKEVRYEDFVRASTNLGSPSPK
ncbi:methionyl-tRNA formyltransferase [Candidatus Nomurabacteria bacterium]|nr:MAG: methionyl-tRNA formyltransferase [Candidatus Nomurabacteria bacterium]